MLPDGREAGQGSGLSAAALAGLDQAIEILPLDRHPPTHPDHGQRPLVDRAADRPLVEQPSCDLGDGKQLVLPPATTTPRPPPHNNDPTFAFAPLTNRPRAATHLLDRPNRLAIFTVAVLAIAAAGSNPSAVTTAIIAVLSAVVGGAIAAVAALLVESRRADRERNLERRRNDRHEQERKREDEVLTRAAARALVWNLRRCQALLRSSADTHRLWTQAYDRFIASPLPDDERRILARHLTESQWDVVVMAETAIAYVEAMRLQADGDVFVKLETKEDVETIRVAVCAIDEALAALSPLAGSGREDSSAEPQAVRGPHSPSAPGALDQPRPTALTPED